MKDETIEEKASAHLADEATGAVAAEALPGAAGRLAQLQAGEFVEEQEAAAAAPPAGKERWPQIVRALRNPDFRVFWSGNFLSNIGTWMQNVALGWLVLQLTNSSFWLGVVGFAGSFPFLLFSLFGGVIADRVNKRYLLVVTQTTMMVLAFLLAGLAYFKIITISQLVVLSFLNGVAQALNAPSYQAMVPQLVRRSDLPNAIALNAAQFNMSRIVGPTLGGYAMAWLGGVAGNFFLNGVSFLAVLASLFRIKYPEDKRAPAGSMWQSLKDGLRYVKRNRQMRDIVLLVSAASLLLVPFLTFVPYFAKNILHADERGLGLLMAFSGLGAVLAAVTIAYLGQIRHRGRVIIFSGIFVMATVIVFCYSHNFWLSSAMQLCEGYGMIMTISTVNVSMQQLSSNEMRGRVMSIFGTAFLGLPPLGSLVAGEVSRHMPTEHAIAAMSGLAMALFIGFFFLSKPLRALD